MLADIAKVARHPVVHRVSKQQQIQRLWPYSGILLWLCCSLFIGTEDLDQTVHVYAMERRARSGELAFGC
jgi:hypothetical protein